MDRTLHAVTRAGDDMRKMPRPEGRALRAGVLAAVALGLLLPIAAGLSETLRAAFGHFPTIGATGPSLAPFADLLDEPGIGRAVLLSLGTGVAATALSLVSALGLCAVAYHRLSGASGARLLAPFLAAPHAALAIGLAFTIAPSGWIARALAPLLGWDRPPDLALVGDPWGLALIAGLIVKEMPFLVLMLLSALTQIPLREAMATGRSLGYGRGLVWMKVIVPQVWPLIRLPVMVVLAYSLSIVDMALILGPSNPPTLAVMLTRMFSDPDIFRLLPASAGALVQLGLVVGSFAALLLAERGARAVGLWWIRAGGRGSSAEPLLRGAAAAGAALLTLGALAMASLVVWSVAFRWPWPAPLPESWSWRAWQMASGGWDSAVFNTLTLAGLTTVASLVLAIAWLEGEDRARRGRAGWAEALIYLPLLLPQIGFLYGLNVLFLRFGLGADLFAVAWAQALFVFPYVMITLSAPWRALDSRLPRAAASLGAGPWRRLVAVKLPVLLAPLLTAAAVGVAVSVAQYLPTLFMGAGRVATLTTEAVTLSSGSDRRIAAAYASLQAALPFAAYIAAFAIPGLAFRNRRALLGGAA
ncbi:ABC transporter permease [Citreimonas sp.]|uniref:ABC transporter permease n=1 Tax=Citreimonas sp. TaxID=3036715 RepID=UPI0035C7E4DC